MGEKLQVTHAKKMFCSILSIFESLVGRKISAYDAQIQEQ